MSVWKTPEVVDYQDMIYKLGWSFHFSTGCVIEWDELVSEGYVAYCIALKRNYNPEKSELSTFIYTAIKNHLISYTNQKLKNAGIESMAEFVDIDDMDSSGLLPDLSKTGNYFDDRLMFLESIGELSEDAQEVCRAIMSSPHEFIIKNKPKLSRKLLREHFKSLKWSTSRIWCAFAEIKEVIQFA